jgi:hypothetical protein
MLFFFLLELNDHDDVDVQLTNVNNRFFVYFVLLLLLSLF